MAQINVLGSFLAGRQARREQEVADQANAMQSYLRAQGPALMRGDQAAIEGLAPYDPIMAMGLNNQFETRRAASAAAFDAKTQAELKSAAAMGLAAYQKGPEAFSAFVAPYAGMLKEQGIDVTYNNFPMLYAKVTGSQIAPEPDKKTDDILEYEYAKSLNPDIGTFEDFMLSQKRAGASQVNVGGDGVEYPKPPEGYDYVRGQDGKVSVFTQDDGTYMPRLVPIPGSAAALKAARMDRADVRSDVVKDVAVRGLTEAINKVIESPTTTTGIVGGIMSYIPGSGRSDLEATLTSVDSATALATLQNMREQSPTGGALGNVTERELDLLKATFGSLKTSQSPAQLTRNLNEALKIYLNTIHGPGNWEIVRDQDGRVSDIIVGGRSVGGGGEPAAAPKFRYDPDTGTMREQ